MSLSNRILPTIFHEKQEPDSSLCAQHCLNNLVQESVWTAADLAELARQLDERELQARTEGGAFPEPGSSGQSGRRRRQGDPEPLGGSSFNLDDLDDDDDNEARMRRINPHLNAGRSRNMDDSGFFSVQVMDEALKSFDLQLVRWRSQDMQSLHSAPEKMESFVFNLSSHWFVIRKFGKSKFFWYDLNSFHPHPKHVSPLYLGLQIDQAEHEGYSVFVVLPNREGSTSSNVGLTTVFSLPHSRADDAVAELAQEARSLKGSEAPPPSSDVDIDNENLFVYTGSGPEFVSATYAGFGGAGNEDEELNRAIEASLQGWEAPRIAPSAAAHSSSRADVYETDDPELAAAIAASLADETGDKGKSKGDPADQQINTSVYEDIDIPSPDEEDADETMDTEREASKDTEIDVEVEEETPPTAEELRLKRLARFGGA